MKYKGGLLETGIEFAFALVFIGILLGAGALALSSFLSSLTGTSASVVGNASTGLLNLSLQMPTVGTIAGVGLIYYQCNSLFWMIIRTKSKT